MSQEHNKDDELVQTSDQLDEHDKQQDASTQEEDQAPGSDVESDQGEDTVSEEVEQLPGAAFQK
jgi:hypothetical protein